MSGVFLMPKDWKCSACHASNRPEVEACENCGVTRPESKRRAAPTAPSRCSVDGSRLRGDGFCELGQGYPVAAVCPFACPHCRRPLAWSGKCLACHGCSTGRPHDWSIPGDRYELEAGHWQLVEKGPRPVCTTAENRAAVAIVHCVRDRVMSAPDGLEELARVFAPGLVNRRHELMQVSRYGRNGHNG